MQPTFLAQASSCMSSFFFATWREAPLSAGKDHPWRGAARGPALCVPDVGPSRAGAFFFTDLYLGLSFVF